MTDRDALLQRILAFDFDSGEAAAYPFAHKLARQTGWSADYAQRAILEYKRYMFLAVTQGRHVCPSEPVDKVWHLHLTYTRSYWQELCKGVLGTDVHHEPSRGGGSEDAKHWAMYEATLDAYRAAFGEEPPADIWPPAEVRFPGMLVSPAPVPGPRHIALAALVASGLLAVAAGGFGSSDPFALEGIRFLGVLVPAMLAAVVIGRMIRAYLSSGAATGRSKPVELDWADAAYLAGGPPRLMLATIAHLIAHRAARVDEAGGAIVAGKNAAGMTSPLERAVIEQLPIAPQNLEPGALSQALELRVAQAFEPRIQQLTRQSMLVTEETASRARRWGAAPMAVVLAVLAMPRLVMGIERHKPVFWLGLAIIAGIVYCLIQMSKMRHRPASSYGTAALKQLREQIYGRPSTATTIGLAVGLAGTAALADVGMDELARLRTFIPKQTSDAGSGSGSDGASGGGDGGSGCGGCGGGGGD